MRYASVGEMDANFHHLVKKGASYKNKGHTEAGCSS